MLIDCRKQVHAICIDRNISIYDIFIDNVKLT